MCSLTYDKYCLEHVDIEVNHRCNLNCLHCSASASSAVSENGLSLKQLKQILSAAKQIGLRRVGFTGGEPLIDVLKLREITDFCRNDLGVPLHIHTNGTLIDKSMVENNGILTYFESISVTFLGGTANDHDEMAGKEGTFESAFEGIRVLAEAGLPLTCFFVPTKSRCKDFITLAEDLSRIGIEKIRILALSPSGRARSIYDTMKPEQAEVQKLEKELMQISAMTGIRVEAGCCTRMSMNSLPLLLGHEVCTSGVNRIHINHRGDVFPCTAASGVHELKIGNLIQTDPDIEKLWHKSPRMNTIRSIHSRSLSKCNDCPQVPRCQEWCMVNICGMAAESLRQYCPLFGPESSNIN